MKNERKFHRSYLHNPHVQGVDYSLFIILLKEMVSMELKGQIGSGSGSFFPPILAVFGSVFCVSPPPHREITIGGYI
jgi:hypothetical protein